MLTFRRSAATTLTILFCAACQPVPPSIDDFAAEVDGRLFASDDTEATRLLLDFRPQGQFILTGLDELGDPQWRITAGSYSVREESQAVAVTGSDLAFRSLGSEEISYDLPPHVVIRISEIYGDSFYSGLEIENDLLPLGRSAERNWTWTWTSTTDDWASIQ